jgi:hypothetical protein
LCAFDQSFIVLEHGLKSERRNFMTSDMQIWRAIETHEGETFRQLRGQEFTYRIESGCVWPSTTNRNLSKAQFRKAWERMPLAGPGAIQDLQGPSYVFAIVTDPRIAQDQ